MKKMVVSDNKYKVFEQPFPLNVANMMMSPIMEEGLLIGIAIVAILIILGIIFGVFDWIAESFGSLFDHFSIGF